MNIPLLNMKREWMSIRKDVVRAWEPILDSMRLLNGPNVKEFESEMASYLNVDHVVSVASGTDALTLGLIAVGVEEGKNVVVAANTFAAAMEAIRLAGAEPRVVDTNKLDYGFNLVDLACAIDGNTAAVIVTHMYGYPASISSLNAVLQGTNAVMVEDASHAHGATYRGQRVGIFGEVGCFSCGPVKNLGCYGDGGFVATGNPEVAERLRALGVHGQQPKNNHNLYGFNSRLDELQAAVLRVKLKNLDIRNAKRVEIAGQYDEAFKPLRLKPIPTHDERTCAYHQYVIRTDRRDELASFLKKTKVGTGIHYPVPLNKQPSFLNEYSGPSCPIAESYAKQILSIPVFPDMTESEVSYVIDVIKSFFE